MATSNEGPLPMFALTEISIGEMVGQGGFSIVCGVEKVNINELYDTSNEQAQVRSDFASSLTESNYVLKTLRTDLPEEDYVKGIVDLAIESEFLSVLKHPNIISMRAIANSDPHESKFFVILDRLDSTLNKKFNLWRKLVGDNSGIWLGPFGYCCSKEQYLYQTWVERIAAARDIANAMYYLHSNQIIYRDLKPDNLGFDVRGALKLFDFGLAKRITSMTERAGETGLYHLTGNTGSLRYMAPEVAQNMAYDQRVDAYSFGILFWQICSLQTPFAGFSTRMHADKVVRDGFRPNPHRSWPTSWVDLMTRSWATILTDRPEFDEIAVFLDDQLEEMKNNEGEVPSRTREIRAKKSRKATTTKRLDADTRISTDQDGSNARKHDTDIV